ncbi:hypothetical protein [Halorubrum salinum]|uniref:hypothetical protein n=1 Tax=Halorubrum salinum TaxID=767517 RepID=UPI0021129226|nr:hypothetical protein [Halorubrum salinum]
MATQEIKSIGIGSLIRLGGLVGAIYGALLGVPVAIISIVAESGFGFVGAIAIILGTAISFGLSIAITGLVYNLLAGVVGGIEVDLQ